MLILSDSASATQPAADFLKELVELLPSVKIWAFGAVSGMMGLAIVLVDRIYFAVRGTSLLKLGYAGIWPTLLVVVLWGLGAGFVGVLGAVFDIFQVTPRASIVVGLAWPITLPRLLAAANAAAEEEQEA